MEKIRNLVISFPGNLPLEGNLCNFLLKFVTIFLGSFAFFPALFSACQVLGKERWLGPHLGQLVDFPFLFLHFCYSWKAHRIWKYAKRTHILFNIANSICLIFHTQWLVYSFDPTMIWWCFILLLFLFFIFVISLFICSLISHSRITWCALCHSLNTDIHIFAYILKYEIKKKLHLQERTHCSPTENFN